MCNNNGELAGNPGKENIRFCGQMVSCMPPGNAHVDFKVVNGHFDNRAHLIEAVPFFRIPLDTGKHPQFHVFIGIRCPAFFCGGTGGFAAYALTLQKAKKLLSGMFSFFNKSYLHQFQNVKAHRLYIR